MSRPSIDQQVTFLHTADLQETAVFYETILGLPLVLDQGSCRIYAVGQDAFVGFCHSVGTRLKSNERTDEVILTLVSDEVDAWYDYLTAKHVLIETPPTLNSKFNIFHCFLRDPNGYLIEIQTFLDPTWPKRTGV